MRFDDVIYVICLLACIGAGNYIKKIRDESQRKMASTGFGLAMIFIVSGFHGLHCLIALALGGFTLIYTHPSICHLATFVSMFGYLVFFRLCHLFGVPSPPGYTNMIQMILTLKVSGVAFEKTASWKRLQQGERQIDERKKGKDVGELIEVSDYDLEVQSIGYPELIHYSMNYIGVLTGPYYRYRTYLDYFDMPFKDYAPSIPATIEKLKNAAFYCSLYMVANYFWPLEYVLSEEFYEQRSFIYRLWYVWPTFLIFRMRIYTGMTLSECVCTMAGFGAYPDEAEAHNGEGPRKPYAHLKRDADKRTYNFTTIVNTRFKDVETCWTFREAMKHWNICVQYWLAINVYKLFPSKKYRTAATLFVSSYWHGFRPGHYMCLMGAPFYVPMEDMWNKLVRSEATGLKRKVIDCIFWVSKFYAFSYLGMAFLLSSFSNIWRYYNSVYHFGYLSWAVLMAVGMYLSNLRKAEERRKQRQQESGKHDAATSETAAHKEKAQ